MLESPVLNQRGAHWADAEPPFAGVAPGSVRLRKTLSSPSKDTVELTG